MAEAWENERLGSLLRTMHRVPRTQRCCDERIAPLAKTQEATCLKFEAVGQN
eukprot:CAMPEP_0177558526 /NCGR_PEP_ID=MMETSP0369-20130122/70319_1 /TAXON_ID=447022 ORGANISM="Scrippsiella hangoei-like, Strain SHHI-4" /NCGR_SAMPLE_ID=MMETSP0369 /ASSEMBLY_ACC=CAM_ASM_000364 /LENGTH=51 /DNA_ID=CAMNT_0019045133 /DNA_START=95 /DNA_END=250 /DNA_ORIENTATION=+